MQNKVIIKVVTIVVKMADRDEERSDSDADFSERKGPRSRGGARGASAPPIISKNSNSNKITVRSTHFVVTPVVDEVM